MSRINEAFETLVDPARRMEYNAMLDGGMLDQDVVPPVHREPPKPVTVGLSHKLKGHRTPVYGLAFSPTTGHMVTTSFDNEIIWWNLQNAVIERRYKIDGATISTVRALADGRVIAAGAIEHLLACSIVDAEGANTWRVNVPDWVSCVEVMADGELVASGSVHRTLSVARASDGTTVFSRRDHSESVTALASSSDGKLLASGSADATVKIWNVATGDLVRTITAVRSAVTAIAISPDTRYLCAAAVDLSVRVYNMADGSLEKVMFGHHKPIEAMAFHPNCWLLATAARDGVIGLWNAAKGLGQLQINASPLPIGSPDGTLLAAGGLDKVLRLWSIEAKDSA
jgi:WD40 repeat protein